ncbi:hypothetical protein [Lichenibacterium minor]|uniref:hypothetical protein n=1 Tax=Lichenibacterium minor TaxID=2316528 RepID=UPI0013EC356F|nr:hypothetical protein [Lichenibacterium minor]
MSEADPAVDAPDDACEDRWAAASRAAGPLLGDGPDRSEASRATTEPFALSSAIA